jgi:hypothetical protein
MKTKFFSEQHASGMMQESARAIAVTKKLEFEGAKAQP